MSNGKIYRVGIEVAITDKLAPKLKAWSRGLASLEKHVKSLKSAFESFDRESLKEFHTQTKHIGDLGRSMKGLTKHRLDELRVEKMQVKLDGERAIQAARLERIQERSLRTVHRTTRELKHQNGQMSLLIGKHSHLRAHLGHVDGGLLGAAAGVGSLGEQKHLADISGKATAAETKTRLSGYTPEEFAHISKTVAPQVARKYHLSKKETLELFNELQAAGVGMHEQVTLGPQLAKYLKYSQAVGEAHPEKDLGNLAKAADAWGATAGKTPEARVANARQFMDDFMAVKMSSGGKVNSQWLQAFSQNAASQGILSKQSFHQMAPLLGFMASEIKSGSSAGTLFSTIERGFMVNGTNSRQRQVMHELGLVKNEKLSYAGKGKNRHIDFSKQTIGDGVLYGQGLMDQGETLAKAIDLMLVTKGHMVKGSKSYLQRRGQILRDVTGTAPGLKFMTKYVNERDREIAERDIARHHRVLAAGGKEGTLENAYREGGRGYLGSKGNAGGDVERLEESLGKSFEPIFAAINRAVSNAASKAADAIADHPRITGGLATGAFAASALAIPFAAKRGFEFVKGLGGRGASGAAEGVAAGAAEGVAGSAAGGLAGGGIKAAGTRMGDALAKASSRSWIARFSRAAGAGGKGIGSILAKSCLGVATTQLISGMLATLVSGPVLLVAAAAALGLAIGTGIRMAGGKAFDNWVSDVEAKILRMVGFAKSAGDNIDSKVIDGMSKHNRELREKAGHGSGQVNNHFHGPVVVKANNPHQMGKELHRASKGSSRTSSHPNHAPASAYR